MLDFIKKDIVPLAGDEPAVNVTVQRMIFQQMLKSEILKIDGVNLLRFYSVFPEPVLIQGEQR